MGYAGYVQRVESMMNKNKISGLTASPEHTDIRIIHSLFTALSLITSYLRHLAYGPVFWVGMANLQPALSLKTIRRGDPSRDLERFKFAGCFFSLSEVEFVLSGHLHCRRYFPISGPYLWNQYRRRNHEVYTEWTHFRSESITQ